MGWKLLAAVAVMQFHWRCVALALMWKLSYARVLYKNKSFPVFSSDGGVFSVCEFSHSRLALQSFKCVCVEHGHIILFSAYIKQFTFHLYHARHSCSVFTALWCGCSALKITCFLHQTPPWLWSNWPVFAPLVYGPVGTVAQRMPRLHCIQVLWTCIKYLNNRTLSYLPYWPYKMADDQDVKKYRIRNCLVRFWSPLAMHAVT